MMSQSVLDASLEAEFAAVAEGSGCELVHVEVLPDRLRVLLDRPQGVTVENCQTVSKQLSALLDVTDFGSKPYVLEVSSPGLDRPLFGPKDYEQFSGCLVRVTFFTQEVPSKRTVVGRLEEYRPGASGNGASASGASASGASGSGASGSGAITVVEQDSGARVDIRLSDIAKARLEIEL